MMNISANSKVRVGVIGVNSRGLALASRFARMAEFEVTHLCDCDSIALEKCSAKVESHCGRKPKLYRDIREMLQQPDLDAVIIAMPDHWHATAAIMAMRAGKHVYLEKPTSYCPAENAMLPGFQLPKIITARARKPKPATSPVEAQFAAASA